VDRFGIRPGDNENATFIGKHREVRMRYVIRFSLSGDVNSERHKGSRMQQIFKLIGSHKVILLQLDLVTKTEIRPGTLSRSNVTQGYTLRMQQSKTTVGQNRQNACVT